MGKTIKKHTRERSYAVGEKNYFSGVAGGLRRVMRHEGGPRRAQSVPGGGRSQASSRPPWQPGSRRASLGQDNGVGHTGKVQKGVGKRSQETWPVVGVLWCTRRPTKIKGRGQTPGTAYCGLGGEAASAPAPSPTFLPKKMAHHKAIPHHICNHHRHNMEVSPRTDKWLR